MIPLTLERRATETQHKDKDGAVQKGKHYTLHIDMAFKLIDLQKYALIDPTKILLELPAPEVEKADIVYEENATIEAQILPATSNGNGNNVAEKEKLVVDIKKKWNRMKAEHTREFKKVYPDKIETYDLATLKKMDEQIDVALTQ
jgi:beta-galactosidase GanA